MDLDIKDLENYVLMLTEDFSLIDSLSDEVVDRLIQYLEKEIASKQEILEKLINDDI